MLDTARILLKNIKLRKARAYREFKELEELQAKQLIVVRKLEVKEYKP